MITWMKKANNFQKAKVQMFLRFCLIFCQFQSDDAYKKACMSTRTQMGIVREFIIKKICINKIVPRKATILRTGFQNQG